MAAASSRPPLRSPRPPTTAQRTGSRPPVAADAVRPDPARSRPARPHRNAHDLNPFSTTPTSANKKNSSPASPSRLPLTSSASSARRKLASAEPASERSPTGQDSASGTSPQSKTLRIDTQRKRPRQSEALANAHPKSQEVDRDDEGWCPACERQSKGDDGTWVECDECETWYHWSCVASTSAESPDNIDKWYCSSCVAASASSSTPLTTTYLLSPLSSLPSSRESSPDTPSAFSPPAPPVTVTRSPPPAPPTLAAAPASQQNSSLRKSSRSTRAQNIDYANLDAHLPASVDRWIKTISAREASGQIVDGFTGKGAFRRFADGHELNREGDEWIYGDKGMMEPFVVTRDDGLGSKMPSGLTVKQVAELVGPKTPLEVIDCASQSSLANWTLGQWADYYEDPQRDKVRNVISLEVSDSKLGEMVTAPELVRKLDWVDTVWPDDMKVPGQYPRVQKYCLMSVSKCWTDWHVDFAGSSVFYHVLRGGKTFFFIRPTPANLQAYEQWSGSSERQEQTWLGDMCDQVYRMDLVEGNTAFIPTGWIHAVYTPADSLVIGGNFLHSLNIPTQLRVYNIELATKVPRKFRYPHFVKLLWLVGKHYYERLSAHPADQPLPLSLGAPRVLDGLKELSSFLIEQTTRLAKGAQVSNERRRLARENIPAKKVPDPVGLSRELRRVVLRARGEPLDAECFLPHVAHVDDAPVPPATVGGTKRKAESPLEMDANAALAALSRASKIRRPTSSSSAAPHLGTGSFPAYASPGGGGGGGGAGGSRVADGEIIGRQNLPVQTFTRTEERIDPWGSAARGALLAEVRESRSTQSVVRRWEHDPLGASSSGIAAGGPVVETRTVITIIERVRFPNTAQAKTLSQQPQCTAYPAALEQEHVGVGPPAPPSVTAVPGTPLRHVGATNPEPHQPYGWPYQYELGRPSNTSLDAPPLQRLPPPPANDYLPRAKPALPSNAMLPPLLPIPAQQHPGQRELDPRVSTLGMANGLDLPPPPSMGVVPQVRSASGMGASYPPPPALAHLEVAETISKQQGFHALPSLPS